MQSNTDGGRMRPCAPLRCRVLVALALACVPGACAREIDTPLGCLRGHWKSADGNVQIYVSENRIIEIFYEALNEHTWTLASYDQPSGVASVIVDWGSPWLLELSDNCTKLKRARFFADLTWVGGETAPWAFYGWRTRLKRLIGLDPAAQREAKPGGSYPAARLALERACGECHVGTEPTAVPAALAIFDLATDDFSRHLSPRQLDNVVFRIEQPLIQSAELRDGRDNPLTPAERQAIKEFAQDLKGQRALTQPGRPIVLVPH